MRGLCFGGVREYDRLESSRARIIPRVVTMMAAVFVMVGIVIGRVFCRHPILRMSCSPLRLWIIRPEHSLTSPNRTHTNPSNHPH